MGTQRILRRREARTPHNSHRDRQAEHQRRRHAQSRSVHRQVKRLGAGHQRDLEVLAASVTPEGEG